MNGEKYIIQTNQKTSSSVVYSAAAFAVAPTSAAAQSARALFPKSANELISKPPFQTVLAEK